MSSNLIDLAQQHIGMIRRGELPDEDRTLFNLINYGRVNLQEIGLTMDEFMSIVREADILFAKRVLADIRNNQSHEGHSIIRNMCQRGMVTLEEVETTTEELRACERKVNLPEAKRRFGRDRFSQGQADRERLLRQYKAGDFTLDELELNEEELQYWGEFFN